MSVTVVTVLHDSAPELRRLLDSLDAHAPGGQVIAVDTGSYDGGAELARARGCEVVDLPENPGFGAANNAGLERARHDVTVLLNPDIELLDGRLLELCDAVRARDALLFPRLLNPDGTVQDHAHPLPGTMSEVLRAFIPARIAPQPYHAEAPRPIGWAIAAAVVGRTATLRRLGPFDPEAFLFYEDLELCLRAHAAGIPCELHPEITLVHAGGHALDAKLGAERLVQEARRRRSVVGGTLGRRALALDDAAQALTFARGGAVRPRSRAQLRALREARRSPG